MAITKQLRFEENQIKPILCTCGPNSWHVCNYAKSGRPGKWHLRTSARSVIPLAESSGRTFDTLMQDCTSSRCQSLSRTLSRTLSLSQCHSQCGAVIKTSMWALKRVQQPRYRYRELQIQYPKPSKPPETPARVVCWLRVRQMSTQLSYFCFGRCFICLRIWVSVRACVISCGRAVCVCAGVSVCWPGLGMDTQVSKVRISFKVDFAWIGGESGRVSQAKGKDSWKFSTEWQAGSEETENRVTSQKLSGGPRLSRLEAPHSSTFCPRSGSSCPAASVRPVSHLPISHPDSRFPIPCSWAIHSVRSSLSSKMRNYESACFTCAGGLVRHTRTQCLRVRRCAYLSLNPRSLGTCSLDLTPPLHSTPLQSTAPWPPVKSWIKCCEIVHFKTKTRGRAGVLDRSRSDRFRSVKKGTIILHNYHLVRGFVFRVFHPRSPDTQILRSDLLWSVLWSVAVAVAVVAAITASSHIVWSTRRRNSIAGWD